uniref:G-protein coupled receptors family 1 profile domain-containing protein n=1 Tax=Laticauda laticaudata TaxID=8630 RepID=A0A8C5WN99_LATLA
SAPSNLTTVTKFLLFGFSATKKLEPLTFASFGITYIIALLGNFAIITLVWCDHSLHIPMYIFIANLFFLETLYPTTVIPKMLDNFMNQRKFISSQNCTLQAYFYFSADSLEFFLLAVMSFDHYIAICNPLRNTAIMNTTFCNKLLAASWMWGYFVVITSTTLLGQLQFCGPNTINHFFCGVEPLLKLACSDTRTIEIMNFVNSALLLLGSLMVKNIGISYIFIIGTVIHIPSAKGRQKAFSTCASDLFVVILFYGSSIFIYIQPQNNHSLDLNKVASILNTQVKEALVHFTRKKISPLIYLKVLRKGE